MSSKSLNESSLQEVRVEKILLNKGQIPGVPKNPRLIRDARFEALKKSIAELPDMMSLRPIVAARHDGKLVAICGNMRLRALRELGIGTAKVFVLPEGIEPYRLREIAIKDNVSFGDDDFESLANEWDIEELKRWGVETFDDERQEQQEQRERQESETTVRISVEVPDEELDSVLLWITDRGYQCVVKKKRR